MYYSMLFGSYVIFSNFAISIKFYDGANIIGIVIGAAIMIAMTYFCF